MELTRRRGIDVQDFGQDRFDDARLRALKKPGTAYIYRERMGDLDHESGGLPLGVGLVDAVGRLAGHDNLYAAGTVLFPRAGAANPSLTTLTLARQQIQHLGRP